MSQGMPAASGGKGQILPWGPPEGTSPCCHHVSVCYGCIRVTTHTQREDDVRTHGEDGHLQAKERDLRRLSLTALRRHQPCRDLDFGR